jgi:hypothetical protein
VVMIFQCDCFCDRCYDWTEGGETKRGNANGLARNAQEMARLKGWRRMRKEDGTYEDVCPACLRISPKC